MKLSVIQKLWKRGQRDDMKAIHAVHYQFEICVFVIIHRFVDDPNAVLLMTDKCTRELWIKRKNIPDPVEFLINKVVKDLKIYLLTNPGVDVHGPRSESWLKSQRILGEVWDNLDLDNREALRDLFDEKDEGV